MFAIIENGALTKYPADPVGDNPGVSFGSGWNGGEVGGKTYVKVAASARPAFDALTQDCVEVTPALVAGVWTQQWKVQAASAPDKAARQKVAADAADVTAAKAHVKLAALRAMTPDQVQAWVEANVTTLAQAKDAIKTLAVAVSILARRM